MDKKFLIPIGEVIDFSDSDIILTSLQDSGLGGEIGGGDPDSEIFG